MRMARDKKTAAHINMQAADCQAPGKARPSDAVAWAKRALCACYQISGISMLTSWPTAALLLMPSMMAWL